MCIYIYKETFFFGCAGSELRPVRSSSPTRDGTQATCIRSM